MIKRILIWGLVGFLVCGYSWPGLKNKKDQGQPSTKKTSQPQSLSKKSAEPITSKVQKSAQVSVLPTDVKGQSAPAATEPVVEASSVAPPSSSPVLNETDMQQQIESFKQLAEVLARMAEDQQKQTSTQVYPTADQQPSAQQKSASSVKKKK